ncbi:MAG: T9SS type A sorting domain-containing protein, partial [Chitinophagaceae bacterium]
AFNPTFSWRNPKDSIVSTDQNPSVAGLAGYYRVTVTDATGCSILDSTLVTLSPRPKASMTGAATICEGGTVSLVLAVTGTGVISGTLSSGDDFSGNAPTITIVVSPTTTTAYTIVSLSDANCTSILADIPDTITVTVTHSGDWHSTIDGDWNKAANWCDNIVPTASTDVSIPAGGIQPVIGAAGGICNNLTISAGASLTITGSNSLTVYGDFINSGGTFTAGTGTVNFNAPTDIQVLSTGGSNFYNISHPGAGTLQLADTSLINTGTFTNTSTGGVFDALTNGLAHTVTGLTTIQGGNYLAGSASYLFNGGLTIAGGIFTGNSGNLSTTNVTIGSGNLIAPSGSFTITGTWTNNGGTFTPGTNKVTFNGTISQTITGSAPTIFNSLTAANAAGINAGNITVNGILTLQTANPSTIRGNLDMGLNTLNMGATATTIGAGDVTGIVRRSTLLAGVPYTFGNQFTSATFQNIGNIPTEFSYKIKIGAAPSWKTDGINRVYDLAFKNGTGFHGAARFHYLDAELNGNTETKMAIYRYIIPDLFLLESGRSNLSTTENWVELANLSGSSTEDVDFGLMEWTFGNSSTGDRVWNGSSNSDWANPLNWTGGVPGPLDNAVIPDSATTEFDPRLPDSTTINTLTVDSSGYLLGGTGKLFLAGADSAWLVKGTFAPDTSTVTFTNPSASMAGQSDFYNVTIDTGAALNMSEGQVMQIFGAINNKGSWNVRFINNTIAYVGANQVVIIPNGGSGGYNNLVLGGSGIKSMPVSAMDNRGNFTIKNLLSVTALSPITIGGMITLEAGTTFNAGGYDHTLKGNWNNSGTFVPGSNTLTFSGDSLQTILGTTVTGFNNLTVTGKGILLMQDVIINSTLTLTTGNVDVGAKTLTMSNASNAIAGSPFSTTNMIIADGGGELRKAGTTAAQAGFLFPVGDKTGTAEYSPVTLTFTSGSFAGYSGVKVNDAKHPFNANTSNYLSRYWSISQNGYTGFSGTVVATYIDGGATTDIVGNETFITMAKWIGTKPWQSFTSSINITNNTLTAIGVTGFGDFSGIDTLHPVITNIVASPSQVVCQNTGLTLTANVTGDTTFTYLWSNGLGTNATATPSTAIPGTTVYSVTVTDGNGSTATSTISITVSSLPSATISYPGSPYCSSSGIALPTLTGTTGGGLYSSTTGLSLNDTSGTINLGMSTPGTYIVTYTIEEAGGCSAFSTTATINITYPGTWTGSVNSDWNNGSNWFCGAIPIATTNVFIPAGLTNYPSITSGISAIHDINIQQGATLTITNATLQITGAITGNGQFIAGNGTMEMAGSIGQTLPPSLFSATMVKDLIINNPSGVILGDTLNIINSLTILNGSLATGGFLTLKSSDTGTARIAPITSNDATPITGTVTVERYVQGRRKYRLITSSVTSSASPVLSAGEESLSIWGNWQNSGNNLTANYGVIITGGTSADGFDLQTTGTSLYNYNAATLKFVAFSSANGNKTKYTPLTAGRAFYMFVYGDRINSVSTATPNNTVLSATGTVMTGDQVYNSGSSSPLNPTNGRFTLLGNPFASPIDWATVPKTDLANTYWGWDPNLSATGGYVTVHTSGAVTLISPFSGATGLTEHIQSGQGFFVQTTGPSPALTIREQDKVDNYNSSAFRTTGNSGTNNIPLIAVNLLYTVAGTRILADGSLAAFGAEFSAGIGNEDAGKMINTGEGIAISNSGKLLSIDARPMPKQSDTLFLNIARLSRSTYTLQVFANDMSRSNTIPFLEDTYLHTSKPISLTDTTFIPFTVNIYDSSTFSMNRFRVIFRQTGILPLKFIAVSAAKKASDIQVNWTVAEVSDIKKYDVERSGNGSNFEKQAEIASIAGNTTRDYQWLDKNIANGDHYYRIAALQNDGKYVYSSIILAKGVYVRPGIVVFPNPVINQKLHFDLINVNKGQFTLQLINSQGRKVISRSIDHSGGTSGQTIPFDQALMPGVYYLQVFNRRERFQETVVIKY